MPLPVVLFLFLAHSVPSLVVRAVQVQTAAWITENRDCVEEQQQGEQLASPAAGQKSSRGEEEGENQRVAEKCSASARTYHGWGTGKCLSKAAEMCPSTPELVQEGDLCISWALGFSVCQPGLVLLSRKLPRPPKHSKIGASSTFQIAQCRLQKHLL